MPYRLGDRRSVSSSGFCGTRGPARQANVGDPEISGGKSSQIEDRLLRRQLSQGIASDARCNGFIRISVDVRRDAEREKTGLFLTVRPSRPDLADSAVPVRGGMEADDGEWVIVQDTIGVVRPTRWRRGARYLLQSLAFTASNSANTFSTGVSGWTTWAGAAIYPAGLGCAPRPDPDQVPHDAT